MICESYLHAVSIKEDNIKEDQCSFDDIEDNSKVLRFGAWGGAKKMNQWNLDDFC